MEITETLSTKLTYIAEQFAKKNAISTTPLAQSGSHRRYFRIKFDNNDTIIGVYNDDIAENQAFFVYSDFFLSKNLNVPKVLFIDESQKYYLLNDLGEITLYDKLCEIRNTNTDFSEILKYYEKVVAQLPHFQMTAQQGLNLSVAYPRAAFDRQSMQWDLNYFKYYYLKMVNIAFNEQLLENDYQAFMDYLLSSDDNFFMYRDFQSRNIMIKDDNVYFIDYQGGRKGALQYDIASLLFDAKADLSPEIRKHLLTKYLDNLEKIVPTDRTKFESYFYAFSLIRIMQAMGAYGYRGYFERKTHFLQSIPYAVRNLRYLLDNKALPEGLPELKRVLEAVVESYHEKQLQKSDKLTVTVKSFSYKRGIPDDISGNGGGFVFDCRALPNPGRDKAYATFTGKDQCVIDYLLKYEEIAKFKKHIFALIDMSVDNYLSRNFTDLAVNFGCTGGRHRSVFFAEQTARHIREKYPEVVVNLQHTNI